MSTQEFELITGDRLRHVQVLVNEITYRNYHFHNAFELLFVLEGRGRIHLVGETLDAGPGKLFLLNPGEPHEIQSRGGPLTAVILQISRNFCAEYLTDLQSIRFLRHDLSGPAGEALGGRICRLARDYLGAENYYAYRCLAETAEVLGVLLEQVPHEHLEERERTARRSRVQRMSRILEYMDAHYSGPVRLRDIAEAEQLSPTYVSHFFTEQLGVSFQDYLSNLRYERAVQLMEASGGSFSEIALRSGFSDPRYLRQMISRRSGAGEDARPGPTPPGASRLLLERILPPEEALARLG